MEPDDLRIDPGFEALRAHRAELLESIRALEQALLTATGRRELGKNGNAAPGSSRRISVNTSN